jgi:2-polyprenyl-3-methyl-5-hydroxy-6-metoxy-1,4-benzoquinol methylase
MDHRTWTKREIEEFLAREDPHYQRIELPFGLSTRGSDRRKTADLILRDVAGKTVFDVGCCLGYFCLEALARGARRAVGWDLNPDRVRQARAIAEMLGAAAEYGQRDIDQAVPEDVFDVVICLNVLHHVRNPLLIIEKLAQVARETLIVEVAPPEGPKAGLRAWQSWILGKFPVIFVGDGRPGRNFYFTRSSIRNLLKRKRHDFARVEVTDSDIKGRFIVTARRLRIDHLVVVAAPAFSSESRFIGGATKEWLPMLVAKLGVESLFGWPQVTAGSIEELTTAAHAGLILHYDLCSLFHGDPAIYEQGRALDILNSAKVVSFLTLWQPPGKLERDLRQETGKRHRELVKAYREPAQYIELYRRWFEFCERLGAKTRHHLIATLADNLKFYSRDEWERMVHEYDRSDAAGLRIR